MYFINHILLLVQAKWLTTKIHGRKMSMDYTDNVEIEFSVYSTPG